MARVVVVMEILPSDPSTNLNDLVERIRGKLPEGFELKGFETKPVAFGLSLVKAVFVIPEEEGAPQKLERIVNGFDEVEEVNVVAMTRL
ncbi:MAG: elongation factor 1-beta [Thaumarchaeota archaeon]|nr:MAG: elongation factor 1-beta [Nitrososphaerota archaeon]HDD66756.1 elongation factor 1-beta [Nitrososphaeria archaeon]